MRVSSLVLLLVVVGLTAPAGASTPPNGWVVWASNRQDGRHEIYLMKSDGTAVKRLTTKGGKFPTFSPDGFWVSYHRDASDEAWLIRPDGTGDKKVAAGKPVFWMADGSGLVVQQGNDVHRYDPKTLASTKLWSKSDFSRIASSTYTLFEVAALTANKRWLVVATDFYKAGATGDNGTFKHGWGPQLLDLQDKSKIYFVGDGCEGTASPTGDAIYHMNGEAYPNTRIFTMNVNDIATRSSYKAELDYPEASWGHEYFPRVSSDGVWLAYGATTGCHEHDTCDYEIHVHKLGVDGDRTRLTTDAGNDQWPHLFVGTLPACLDASHCDDSDPCTAASCVNKQCKHTAVTGCCTEESQCADSSACTKDSCSANKCSHAPIAACCAKDGDCDDGNACTADACETGSGTCANTPRSGCCAVDVDCEDGDACTLDRCELSSHTCQHQPSCGADAGPDRGVGRADAGPGDAARGEGATGGASRLAGGCSLARRARPGPEALLLVLTLAATAALVRRRRRTVTRRWGRG